VTSPLVSSIYEGVVAHRRRLAPEHPFAHRVYMLFLDLDELPEIERRIPLFGHRRRRPVELRDGDHFTGRRRDGLRTRLARTLEAAGVAPPGGPVRVLTQARVLGQGFNPVSFWWCHDASGRLACCVAEVNNTFGDRHPYVLPVDRASREGDLWVWRVRKRMHVSPFMDMAGDYEFRIAPPGARLRVEASLVRGGETTLEARFEARRVDLSVGSLGSTLLRLPLMPWMVWGAIHAQALRLWRKGARFHHRPPYRPEAAGPDPT